MRTNLLPVLAFAVGVALLPSAAAYAFTGDEIAQAINVFFPNTPEMVAIARCESGLRQYTANGSVLRGGAGGAMVGLFQFNEVYHRAAAAAMGLDLDTLLGNLAYARELYSTEGLTPWNSSRSCWAGTNVAGSETSTAAAATASTAPAIRASSTTAEAAASMGERHAASSAPTASSASAAPSASDTDASAPAGAAVPHASASSAANLTITGTIHFWSIGPDAYALQQQLGAAGYLDTSRVAEGVFDIPTYQALIAFQCDQQIACLASGDRTGLGMTDARTRAALHSAAARIATK